LTSTALERSVGVRSAVFIRAARRKLLQQRAFRLKQLEMLEDIRHQIGTDAARAEIHLALRTAAHMVLADIEAALRRIDQGSYGLCRRCRQAISVHRLDALPMASLCGGCHRRQSLTSGTQT
jgi:RNA polymerase-binding transcription factor DksA